MIRKVIVNKCYGGYSWSKQGAVEVLRRKGFEGLHYWIEDEQTGDWVDVNQQEFINRDGALPWLWYITTGDLNPDENYLPENAQSILHCCFDREDAEAVAVLEEFGSDVCSGEDAYLKIIEFDDEYFEYDIENHDGFEVFKVSPHLTRDQVLKCNSLAEVADILEKIGVIEKSV